jgi:hypothetical protein
MYCNQKLDYICPINNNKTQNKMTNSKAQIEIKEVVATEKVKGTILIVKEQPVIGGGINETKSENTIYDASIVYEF